MAVIALTGGIGSGKSLAAEYFASLGADVIDADQLSRQAIERGTPGFDAVVTAFGDGILKDGSIDRRALADIVFKDPEARTKLEEIVHPYVRELFKEAVTHTPQEKILIYEIPLLVETGAAKNFDFIVTVEAPDELRKERLLKKGLHISDIEKRMAAQATSEQRRTIADAVIENNGDTDALLRSCEKLWEGEFASLKYS